MARPKRIVKKSVALSERNIAWAEAQAVSLGVSFSEVIRRAMSAAEEKEQRKSKSKREP